MAEYILTRLRRGHHGTASIEALGGGGEWGQRKRGKWQFMLLFDTVKEAIEEAPAGLEWGPSDFPSMIAAVSDDGTTYVIGPAPKPR